MVAQFQAPIDFGFDPTTWQDSHFPNHVSFVPENTDDSATHNSKKYSGMSDITSPQMASSRPMPEFVQPQERLSHDAGVSTSSPMSRVSSKMRTCSIYSTSSSVALPNRQLLRRMSLAAIVPDEDSYRPRNTLARRKRATTELEKTRMTIVDDLEKGQRRTGSLRTCKACNHSELYTGSGNFIDEWNMGMADHGKVFTRNKG